MKQGNLVTTVMMVSALGLATGVYAAKKLDFTKINIALHKITRSMVAKDKSLTKLAFAFDKNTTNFAVDTIGAQVELGVSKTKWSKKESTLVADLIAKLYEKNDVLALSTTMELSTDMLAGAKMGANYLHDQLCIKTVDQRSDLLKKLPIDLSRGMPVDKQVCLSMKAIVDARVMEEVATGFVTFYGSVRSYLRAKKKELRKAIAKEKDKSKKAILRKKLNGYNIASIALRKIKISKVQDKTTGQFSHLAINVGRLAFGEDIRLDSLRLAADSRLMKIALDGKAPGIAELYFDLKDTVVEALKELENQDKDAIEGFEVLLGDLINMIKDKIGAN